MNNNINKKKIILFLILGSLLITLLVAMFFPKADNNQPNEKSTPPPSTPPSDINTLNFSGTTPLNIKTPGGDVLMQDPRVLPDTIELGDHVFNLTSLEDIPTVSYGVIFNESNGSFAIGLEREPIAQARRDAEQYLMDTLLITPEDMCRLNIFVGVPYQVNQFYSGKNLGVSFCPGSVSLE